MCDIIEFIPDVDRYRKLAGEKIDKSDLVGALAFLFSAKNISCTLEVITDIADVYADMGLFELSNKYWFLYLDRAPQERASIAYEELAINYFYLDNYWASSFYFHKKLDVDGHISKEGLDKEIIDFFSGEEMKKNAYRLAYPFERADYSYNLKLAKHFLSIGAFKEAKKSLSEIPDEVRTEEASGELALANFMSDDLDEAERICRLSLEKDGDNVTAYCHLSTVYNMRKDYDNAEYYYQKALSARKGEKGEEYNLATCAIEREDHLTSKQCLEKILEERPFETSMRFFYGISFLNIGEYERAEKEFALAYRINPSDFIALFYLRLTREIIDGNTEKLRLLPLKYEKELPEKIVKEYSKKLRELVQTPSKIESALKKKEVKEMVEWGLYHGEEQASRDAVFILSSANSKYSRGLIKTALLDSEVKEEVKRVLIYVWIFDGNKEKFGATVGSFYTKIKPRKVVCEKFDDGMIYFSAYALCIARIAFWETENLDVVGKVCDKVYKSLKGKITESEVTNEELAALMLSECKYKWVKSLKDVTGLFEITKQKLEKLKEMLKGENNG